MWSSRAAESGILSGNRFASGLYARRAVRLASVLLVASLAACTVEPLNRANTDSALATGAPNANVRAILAGTEISPVDTRVAQQTRNELLRLFGGGNAAGESPYRVDLLVTSKAASLAVETSAKAPTAAQVTVTSTYRLMDIKTGETVDTGRRTSLAAYDRTPQAFANQRAKRDAENRAAREAAQQIFLAISQAVAKR